MSPTFGAAEDVPEVKDREFAFRIRLLIADLIDGTVPCSESQSRRVIHLFYRVTGPSLGRPFCVAAAQRGRHIMKALFVTVAHSAQNIEIIGRRFARGHALFGRIDAAAGRSATGSRHG